MDELLRTLTLIQTRTIKPVPVILIGRHYRERVVDFEFLLDEGVIDSEDRGILDWHDQGGDSLIAPESPGHVNP